MSWFSSLFGSSKGAPSYTPTPYTGARPPSVDVNGTNYLRSTQALTQDIIPKRAQGIDVGYSPEWLNSSQALIRSELGKAQEDRLRETKGSLSAQGLSGNPRAYEATAGRVQRDTQRELQDATSKLTIADMERKNQERDVNTARLQALNASNFGQENAGANFDLDKWSQENQFSRSAAGLNAENYWTGVGNQQDLVSDVGQTALALAMPETAPSIFLGSNQPGTGINPSASALGGGYSTSLKQSPEYNRRMRFQA